MRMSRTTPATSASARGVGDISTLTVAEYRARTCRGQLAYRLYRNPVVMFGIGPAFLFLFKQRLPFGMMRSGALPWVSTMANNAAIAALAVLAAWAVGIVPFLSVHLPIVLLAGSAGVWLFYVQHQFIGVYWERNDKWDYTAAALRGSSYYRLPKVLQWISGNIGFHHSHHLSPRIPNYNLQRCHESDPRFAEVTSISLRASLQSLKFRLWDEQTQQLVGFAHIRKQGRPA